MAHTDAIAVSEWQSEQRIDETDEETIERVQIFLESLSPEERALLLDRYEMDETLEELAAKFGLSVGGVWSRVKNLLERARRRLKNEQH